MCKRWLTLSVAAVCLVACDVSAATYRVGPGEKNALLSHVAGVLKPGDTVVVTGDITDTVTLTAHGSFDAPITIKGEVKVVDGRIVRPVIHRREKNYIMAVNGNHTIIEGLEFNGYDGSGIRTTGMFHGASDIVLRNCRFAFCARKAIQGGPTAGSLTIEFCEFDSCGWGPKYHSVDLFSRNVSAVMTIRYSWFHNGVGGNFLKSHASRNVIRCNWFESPFYGCVNIVDLLSHPMEQEEFLTSPLYPMHTDIVGNVFIQGWSPGSRWSTLRLGGEHETAPGTEGDFNIAHNLFIHTRTSPGYPGEEGVHIYMPGNVDRLRLYNNVFLELGIPGVALYRPGATWPKSPRTKAFAKRRGNPSPVVEGANNWVSVKCIEVPTELVGTLRGKRPFFVDLVNFDFRLRPGSPLVGAGLSPLPPGRIIDLAPEYEPLRGIPADLTPIPRRKMTPASIGPFEPAP